MKGGTKFINAFLKKKMFSQKKAFFGPKMLDPYNSESVPKICTCTRGA